MRADRPRRAQSVPSTTDESDDRTTGATARDDRIGSSLPSSRSNVRQRAAQAPENAASKATPLGAKSRFCDELAGLLGARLAVHAGVFPFDRQRPVVLDLVERADDFFEVHAAAPRRAEIPAAARIAKRQVAAQDARCDR